jgi:hypothetical protein
MANYPRTTSIPSYPFLLKHDTVVKAAMTIAAKAHRESGGDSSHMTSDPTF